MKIKETEEIVKVTIYEAEDGKKFTNQIDCMRYEYKCKLQDFIEKAEKLRIEELDEELPLDNVEMSENNTFRWYKVNNKEEFDVLCEACKEQWEYPSCYPEIICVETVGYEAYNNDDCYIYYLSILKRVAEEFYKKLGYKVTFEKVGD